MSRRYFPARADSESDERWFERDAKPMGLTVFEPDNTPQDTGLLDAHGNRLMAVSELDPIGFIRGKSG